MLGLVKQSGRGLRRSDSRLLSMCSLLQEADFLGRGVGRGEEAGPRRGLRATAADERRRRRHLRRILLSTSHETCKRKRSQQLGCRVYRLFLVNPLPEGKAIMQIARS